ncbi:MAG: hypothetical protein LBJ93_03330 [Clostridiales bacterium]|nr:hypothetical protein [Clostridiales bacterium]
MQLSWCNSNDYDKYNSTILKSFNCSNTLIKILAEGLLEINNILGYLELNCRCSDDELTRCIKILISIFSEITVNNSIICRKLFNLCAHIKFYMMVEVKSKYEIIIQETDESKIYERCIIDDDLDWDKLRIITRQLLEKRTHLNFMKNFIIAFLIITGSTGVTVGVWLTINLHNMNVVGIISISLGVILLLTCIFWLIFEIHKKNSKRRDLCDLAASK